MEVQNPPAPIVPGYREVQPGRTQYWIKQTPQEGSRRLLHEYTAEEIAEEIAKERAERPSDWQAAFFVVSENENGEKVTHGPFETKIEAFVHVKGSNQRNWFHVLEKE